MLSCVQHLKRLMRQLMTIMVKKQGIFGSNGKFCFGLNLSHLVFSGAEQLSLILQGKDTTIQKATMAADMTIQYLQRQRFDSSFNQFYSQVVKDSKDLTSPPFLRIIYRRPPKRIDDGTATAHNLPLLKITLF